MILKIIILTILSIAILTLIIGTLPIIYIYILTIFYNALIFIINYKITKPFEILFIISLISFNLVMSQYNYTF